MNPHVAHPVRRGLVAVAASAALLIGTSACGTAAGESSASAGGSTAAADEQLSFTSTTVAGDAFDGASLDGRPTVLWFWAPWCPTCRAQVPAVGALAERYAGTVNVVGVGGLDDSGAIGEYAPNIDAAVTVLDDPDGAVWRHFGVTAQSTYVILDAQGQRVGGGALSDEDLADTVSDLVA